MRSLAFLALVLLVPATVSADASVRYVAGTEASLVGGADLAGGCAGPFLAGVHVGGACGIRASGVVVVTAVDDALGPFDFSWRAFDATNAVCGEGRAASGDTLSLGEACVRVSVYAPATATTGVITVSPR